MTSSECGKLLWAAFFLPLAGCSNLSAGAAFAAFFNAGILVMVVYAFVERWIRGDFKRPVWLESIYAITIVSITATVVAKVFGLGDVNVLNIIGLVSFSALGLAVALEALLGMFGVKVDLGLPEGAGKFSLALYGLISLLVVAGVIVYFVNTQ